MTVGDAETHSVFIAEDASELRQLMRRWLDMDEGLHVVGEAGTGDEALAGIARTSPSVVVLDLAMPRSRGTGMVAAVREVCPKCSILVVTGTSLEWSEPALEAADGYLLKPVDMAELVRQVRRLAPPR